MKDKIQKLLDAIMSADWGARTTAITELMQLSDPACPQDFYELLDKKSELLCVYFCQFLSKTLLITGIPYLVEFLNDPRERIQQEAVWAFDKFLQSEKIDERKKVSFLIQTLQTAQEKGKVYAAQAFGKFYKREGVMYLIDALKDPSDKVRLASLDSLREIGDLNCAPYLAQCIQDSSYNVRYAVAFALGEFGISLYWKHMIPLITDPRLSVRQAAVWAIARLGEKNAIPYLKERLKSDPAPLVRIEAVKRLGKIGQRSVVYPLLEAFARDEHQSVKSAANYALDDLDDSVKLSVYFKQIHSEDSLIRTASLGKIAKIKSPHAFSIIEKVFKKSSHLAQIQATCCECFGVLGNKKAIPLLQKALISSPIVGYSAIRALSMLLGNEEKELMISLISDPTLPEISKQVILQFILKKINDKQLFLDADISKLMIENLKSKHLNISYMCARILGASHDLSAIVPLLTVSHSGQDPELKRKCFDAIGAILDGNFILLIKLLKQPFLEPHLKEKIFQCLLTFECQEKYRLPTVVAILQYYLESKETYRIQIISLLSHIVSDTPQILLQTLYQIQWPDAILKDILFTLDGKIIERDPRNSQLMTSPLHRHLESRDPHIRILTIRLLEKIGQSQSIATLVSLYYREIDTQVKQYTKSAIRSIVEGGLSVSRDETL